MSGACPFFVWNPRGLAFRRRKRRSSGFLGFMAFQDARRCGMNSSNEGELVSNRFANPKTMPAPRGYTQVVETTGPGRIIYLSGQLGMTPGGAFAGTPGDFRAQATQCFENLKAGLVSVGGGFEHVVKITNFFID